MKTMLIEKVGCTTSVAFLGRLLPLFVVSVPRILEELSIQIPCHDLRESYPFRSFLLLVPLLPHTTSLKTQEDSGQVEKTRRGEHLQGTEDTGPERFCKLSVENILAVSPASRSPRLDGAVDHC